MGINLHDLGFGEVFLDLSSKAQAKTTTEIDKLAFKL